MNVRILGEKPYKTWRYVSIEWKLMSALRDNNHKILIGGDSKMSKDLKETKDEKRNLLLQIRYRVTGQWKIEDTGVVRDV